MNKWYMKKHGDEDVAVSTRIRLARNLIGYPFENRMTAEQKKHLFNDVKTVLTNANLGGELELNFIDLEKLTEAQIISLVERHLISPNFAGDIEGRGLILSSDETVSIMVNEEDHIRIQVLSSGLNLKESLDLANKIDDILDASLRYAFDQKLGYLTQCPTNIGTGLRASVMLHLPALEENGVIGKLSSMVSKLGLTIRGTYGEGTRVNGAFYQLSNQVTLGISEEGATENLKAIALQIIAQERAARENEQGDALEDKVWRAYGILNSARLMSSDEFVELISIVRMGVSQNIIKGISYENVSALIAKTGAATIMAGEKASLTPQQRDKLRAEKIREYLYSLNAE